MTPDGKVLLLVDDDEHLLLLSESFLRRLGMIIRTACSGNEAISMIRDGPTPDVIISDLNMADGSGLDLLKYVRGSGSLSEIPLFILSATQDQQEMDAVTEYGCTEFLTKPCDYGELLKRVAQQLSVTVRDAPRFAVDLAATLVRNGELTKVQVRNISELGIYFEGSTQLEVDAIYRLDTELPSADGCEVLSLQILPVRGEESLPDSRYPFGYGSRILTTTEWKRRRLREFLATLDSGAMIEGQSA